MTSASDVYLGTDSAHVNHGPSEVGQNIGIGPGSLRCHLIGLTAFEIYCILAMERFAPIFSAAIGGLLHRNHRKVQNTTPPPPRRLLSVPRAIFSLLFSSLFNGPQQELRLQTIIIRACLAARSYTQLHVTTQKRRGCLPRRPSRRRRSCWAGRVTT